MTSNCLTIDVGTTNTKVTLWYKAVPELKKFPTPKIVLDSYTNFNLQNLWQKILDAIKAFNSFKLHEVNQISIAGVGESGILIDKDQHEVGQCIAWFDERSKVIADQMTADDKRRIYEITGLPLNAHYSACKIAWLLKYDDSISEPDNEYVWLCIPDYLVFKFTGKFATENTIASRTLCLDVRKREWSNEVKDIFNIKSVNFPQIHRAGSCFGIVNGKLAGLLADNCSVTIAGHDHMCGASGVQLGESELLDSTGTTEAIMTLEAKPDVSIEAQNMAVANGIYIDGEHYTRFTAMPSAGLTIEWFKNALGLSGSELTELLKRAEKGYNDHSIFKANVLVIPHFNGSGAPHKLPDSKGLIYGLTWQTSTTDLIFGLFLGLTFEFYLAYETLFKKRSYSLVKVIGPAVLDPLWLQIKADLLGLEIEGIESQQAVSEGAYSISTRKHVTNNIIKYIPTGDKQKLTYLRKMLNIYKTIYTDKVSHHL